MSAGDLSRDNIVAFLADIFERRGGEGYLGEPVTMAEHMLQGATLAEEAGHPDEIIVAALLHDIGHFTSEFGTFSMEDTEDKYHEEAGTRVLERFLPSTVTDCVRHHVAAKRYLCAIDPGYFGRLSEASVLTLKLQGGPMTATEIEAFRELPNLDDILQVRIWDDQAKVAGVATPSFAHYAPLLQRLVDLQRTQAGRRNA